MRKRHFTALAAVAGVSALGAGVALANAVTGPSSSQSPYVVRSEPGVVTKAIITVGDAAPNGYKLVGIPDGLGAFDNGDGTFTVLANHELGGTAGAVRAHGAKGAFVSKWTLDTDTLEVLAGEDLIKQVATWNAGTGSYNAPVTGVVLNRFCSATLALQSAFFNPATGKGYEGRLFADGEEVTEGRAFAHQLDGTSYELPGFGKIAYENVMARPAASDTTVVVTTDDTSPRGQVYVWIGNKKATGSSVERAGLTDGTLYGVKVAGAADEPTAGGYASGTPFSLVALSDQRGKNAAALQSESETAGVTEFLRPEDGDWDTVDPNRLYFVSTASFSGPSRLWRLNFADPTNPAAGGTIDMLLDGSEGQRMMDNIDVNRRGQVLIQEDPGNQDYLAKIRLYDPATDAFREVAKHDPDRFTTGAPNFLTRDEESSGIIDAGSILGEGWYLGDVQAHYAISGELVEGGQLFALHVPPGRK